MEQQCIIYAIFEEYGSLLCYHIASIYGVTQQCHAIEPITDDNILPVFASLMGLHRLAWATLLV